MANTADLHEYAFEMAASNIRYRIFIYPLESPLTWFRYGKGVTSEVGYDLKDLKATKIAVFADPHLAKMPGASPVAVVLKSLDACGLSFEVFRYRYPLAFY